MGWPGKFIFAGYRRLLTHPRYGFWVALVSILYLLSPIDLLPDLMPVLGQVDDGALLLLMGTVLVQGVLANIAPGERTPEGNPTTKGYGPGEVTVDVESRRLEDP